MMRESGGESTFSHYLRTDSSGARAIPPALLDRWLSAGWLERVSIPQKIAPLSRSVVLDPFFGSGTSGQVAMQLGRKFIGCELNPAYKPLQDERLSQPSLDLEAA